MVKEHKAGTFKDLFWLANKASTARVHKKHMDKIKEVQPTVYSMILGPLLFVLAFLFHCVSYKISRKFHDWLSQKPKQQWTRSAFRTTPCADMFVNNHCEVFNASIRKYRDLLIITILREIHKAVMKRIQVRRDKVKDKDIVIFPSA